MKFKTFTNIKKEVKLLQIAWDAIEIAFPWQSAKIISTCLHNIFFETTNEKEMEKYMKVIEELANFEKNNQFIQYAWEQLNMIWVAAQQMEIYEDNIEDPFMQDPPEEV
jgi:hypothetical protein